MSENLPNYECSAFENPYNFNFYFSVWLAIGILVSYLPQHIRIIRRRTSEGISPWFLLLGISSGICAVFNILLLSTHIYECCSVMSGGQCFAASLAITQICIQATAASLILIFALVFTHNQLLEPKEDYYELLQVGKFCLVQFIFCMALSIYVYWWSPKHILVTANILGIAGAILAAFQYFPQIYTTLHLQHVGSLSIPMMCMQTPGGFAWAASLAFRKGTVWSSWLPYLTAAILQGVLLTIAVYFEVRNRRRAKVAEELLFPPSESSPLLPNA